MYVAEIRISNSITSGWHQQDMEAEVRAKIEVGPEGGMESKQET